MTRRAQEYQARLLAAGLCPHCRQPREQKPDGSLYLYCRAERRRRANAAKMRYYARKQNPA